MLVLSIDTSGKSGGVTLASGDATTYRMIESAPIAGGTFSAQLVPTLALLLRKHGFAARDLDGLVALTGPGSFTGLRVGLSAVKGLAEVLKTPIAAVSLLEALAITAGVTGRVVSLADAGRGEVYFGCYETSGSRGARVLEELLTRGEFIDAIKKKHPVCIVSSDREIVELAAHAGISVQEEQKPGSESAARIGLQKLLAGDTVGVEELDANYLRRSDAEIFSKPKI
jgi:tRNA threonylcarbamoyladenosine biosynthesis protein TsaB